MRWGVKDKAGPKLDRDLFLEKVIKPAGIPGEEVLSCQASASGWIFLLSFITHTLYRKYWKFFQGKKGEKPFNSFNISTGWEPASTEKRITVKMTNPHIPDRDIALLLQRYGTIAKGSTKVRDKRSIWNTTWQAIINLHKDPAVRDGLRHPPASFYLGADEGRIRYLGQPFTCRKCQAVGYKRMDCPRSTAGCADQPDTRRADAQGKRCATSVEEKATPTTSAQSLTDPEPTQQQLQQPQPRRPPDQSWTLLPMQRITNPQDPTQRRTDLAPPLETAVSVEPTHLEGIPEKGAATDAPPPEAQGEPEQTPETGAEEGKEPKATTRTPTPTLAPEKTKKKSKHSKKKVDNSSEDEEEIVKAWKEVKSQRLRDKYRKEKEEKEERRRTRTKG
ncbi:hypothetical protein NDU88_011114 [Pleurodeles waltl]|uniref:Zinc finger CCHC domain-containing protein n=1 Tax=Pleurodeles waltl TaxID=8319 RepID=A0AAV7R031_PLEWA|nr:hypothetical protein NDU88_011114 [Pleurodeles waltl]